MLISTGAKFDPDNIEVARELSIAAAENDIERLKLWAKCNVNMNMSDLEGRSPLHVVFILLLPYYDVYYIIFNAVFLFEI